jgi:membrane glycosyltransferase
LDPAAHALLVFCYVMTLLLLPKVLSLLELAFDGPRRRAFGGFWRAAAGVTGETFFSVLHSPIQMLFQTGAVASTLLGIDVQWTSQKRKAGGMRWRDAARRHWLHTGLGIGWGYFTWQLDPETFYWFIARARRNGIIDSDFICLSGQEWLGGLLRRAGLYS